MLTFLAHAALELLLPHPLLIPPEDDVTSVGSPCRSQKMDDSVGHCPGALILQSSPLRSHRWGAVGTKLVCLFVVTRIPVGAADIPPIAGALSELA